MSMLDRWLSPTVASTACRHRVYLEHHTVTNQPSTGDEFLQFCVPDFWL